MLTGATGVTIVLPAGEHRAHVHHDLHRGRGEVAIAPRSPASRRYRAEERLRAPFFVGFAVAMAGVCLVSSRAARRRAACREGGLGQAGLIGVALALAAAEHVSCV